MVLNGSEWHSQDGRAAVLHFVAERLNEQVGGERFEVEVMGLDAYPTPFIHDTESGVRLGVEPNWSQFVTYSEKVEVPYLIHARCIRHYKLRQDGSFNVEKVVSACNGAKNLWKEAA